MPTIERDVAGRPYIAMDSKFASPLWMRMAAGIMLVIALPIFLLLLLVIWIGMKLGSFDDRGNW